MSAADKNILRHRALALSRLGYRSSQIGEVLEVSERTARRYVHEAREQLVRDHSPYSAQHLVDLDQQLRRLLRTVEGISANAALTPHQRLRAVAVEMQIIEKLARLNEAGGYANV